MPLVIASLITITCSVVLFILDTRTKFGKINNFLKQTIIGIIFGLCAIYATELGSFEVFGAAMNCRDAAPICAGLLFGPWSGILSGLIGGIERYFATFHGIGIYTQLACSLACVVTGCLAGFLKLLIFKKNRPTILHAIVLTLVCEAIHMGFVPLTHMNDLPQATVVMVSCFVPLVVSNTCAVLVAFLITSVIAQRNEGYSLKEIITRKDFFFAHDLFFSFQFWLLLIVVLCFGASTVVSSLTYEKMAYETIAEKRSRELESIAGLAVMSSIQNEKPLGQTTIDMANEWVDIAVESGTENVTYMMVVDPDNNRVSNSTPYDDQQIINNVDQYQTYELIRMTVNNEETGKATPILALYTGQNGYKLIVFSLEKYEMYLPHISMATMAFLQIAIFAILMLCIFLLLKKLVGQNLGKINKSLEEITAGNLEERVNVYSHIEFANLSDSINQTVDKLKEHIDIEANRFKKDFEMAHQIQISALPNVFPAFPSRTEIDIYATYQPAKEVGGDFYDYYFLDKENLAFLIADVSGKGIPAAMFMMRAKTALRAFAKQELEVGDILATVNDYLCTNNEAEMFVTCWFGILNTKTGVLRYASAGHNPPLIARRDGSVAYLENKVGLVLAGMEGIPYKSLEARLCPGDMLMLYTDGLTEANNEKLELYGEARLLKAFEQLKDKNCGDLLVAVKSQIDQFVGDCEQFDDMTMLALQYFGENYSPNSKHEFEITVEAKLKNQKRITTMLEDTLSYVGAPPKVMSQLDVVVDEIFSNICKYGYEDENQLVTVDGVVDAEIEKETGIKKRFIRVSFADVAVKFNPIDVAEPDITLSAEERDIGGLGIHMVRNIMDDVFYEYQNGANKLTVVKYF